MKKHIILINSLLIILLFSLCSINLQKVRAEEETWFTEAAERANNPILLEDEQYFQGISLNSHIISDLTFMEIPFADYLVENNLKTQIITFSEALYRQGEEVKSEIVMYVYYPDARNHNVNRYIYTDVDFKSQEALYPYGHVDVMTNAQKYTTHKVKWQRVSSYGNITKYSFPKYSSAVNPAASNSFSKLLMKEYRAVTQEVKTIFNAKITKYTYTNGDNFWIDVDDTFESQEFQYIYAKNTPLAVEGVMTLSMTEPSSEHVSLCAGNNTNSITVSGETRKFRYKTSEVGELKFVGQKRETEFTDIFYLFFNVLDDNTKKEWGSEKYIREVKLNYVEALITTKEYKEITSSDIREHNRSYKIDFFESNGNINFIKEDNFNITGNDIPSYVASIASNYMKNETLYQEDIITPKELNLVYLENSSLNSWVAFTAGFYQTRKANYLTLFDTKSEEFTKISDLATDKSNDLINKYQFGLVYGNENGYPVTSSYNETLEWLGTVRKTEQTDSYYHVEVVDVIDIEYQENGNIYRVSVSESNIDNSKIDDPIDQDQDFWEDEPGPSIPKNPDKKDFWYYIQKILEFFKVTLPLWFKENSKTVITVVSILVIIFVSIFIAKLIKYIQQQRLIKQLKKNNKKE